MTSSFFNNNDLFQDLHIVLCVILMFTNRLTSIKVPENKKGWKLYKILRIPMSEQPKLKNERFSAKVEKDDPYLLFVNRI